MNTNKQPSTPPQTPVRTKAVRGIDLFEYQRGTSHTAVVFGRVRTDEDPNRIVSTRTYRYYHSHYRLKPAGRISFSSLLRLRRATGRLFEAGRIEGYTWTCEYDETLNGHMRIKGE
jgi:hypothetical protein